MATQHFFLGNDKRNLLASKNEANHYDYNEEQFVYDVHRKNDSHIAVVNEVKENSTVLDIGCASGLIGRLLTKYKNCIVDGIEYDKTAFEVAKGKGIFRNIFNFSIVETDSKEYFEFSKLQRKYDYIIFADVLEHLVEPWQALISVSKFLKKNGNIIISIPNIAHLDIIKGLINNEFNYTELGILDKTHLRFFTPISFSDMIKNIANEYNVYFNVQKCGDMIVLPSYFNGNDYSLFDINSNLESYFALQNIYKLQLVDSKEKMKSNIKNKNKGNFDEILKNYNFLKKEVMENKNKCELLENSYELKIKEYQNRLTVCEEELKQLKNSKRWKLINKIFRIFGK